MHTEPVANTCVFLLCWKPFRVHYILIRTYNSFGMYQAPATWDANVEQACEQGLGFSGFPPDSDSPSSLRIIAIVRAGCPVYASNGMVRAVTRLRTMVHQLIQGHEIQYLHSSDNNSDNSRSKRSTAGAPGRAMSDQLLCSIYEAHSADVCSRHTCAAHGGQLTLQLYVLQPCFHCCKCDAEGDGCQHKAWCMVYLAGTH